MNTFPVYRLNYLEMNSPARGWKLGEKKEKKEKKEFGNE